MNNDAQSRWYSGPGIWFWIVVALGAALRFYLVVFTDGTQDVAIWERHARDVRDHGLIGYYHGDPSANHPPFISGLASLFFPRWFFIPALVLVGGYIYFLYAYLCGNPWLIGVWDFTGHPYWPFLVVALRNAAYLLFCGGAIWFSISTTVQAFRVRL